MSTRWYFDFISPFAYLQWPRVRALQRTHAVELRPVLLAGLLAHHGQKGPAEIAGKRTFTYRHVVWKARELGMPLRFPPAHPFNPLAALRLCAAAGSTADAVTRLFDHIWAQGCAAQDAEALQPVANALGLDAARAINDPDARAALRANFDAAVGDGVFGVPTFVTDGWTFWGEDATAMHEQFLRDRTAFESGEMARVATLPVGASRRI